MSDLVVNTRQIVNYPALTAANGTEAVLVQQGGLGGPYASIATAALVSTALQNTPMGIGTPIPAGAAAANLFVTQHVAPPFGNFTWNLFWDANNSFHYWQSGLGAAFDFANGTLSFQITPVGEPGATVESFTALLNLTPAGNMSLPQGTLTVARDPSSALEVATMGYVGAHTVNSFNARTGAVQLWSNDIYSALGLCSPIATEEWVTNAINASLQSLLMTCPFVNRWNGRTGSVYLMLSDISCVFFQSGQQPITPTPPATSNDYSIANTAWVQSYVTETIAGNQGLATQAWVQANTVASFNGRIGAVTLALSDITTAGGAPQTSPQLLGVPTAPTQAVGNATSAIATTAFVWNAVQESTTGVVSWNGRTGVVDLTATDINDAGGALLSSPAFSGTPTAPTAPTGTTTTQLATCAFVLNEVQAIGAGVTTFNTRSGNVVLELADIEAAGGAPIASPAFSGNPTCPTPSNPVTSTTSIANTAWVVQYAALSTVASFNTRIGAVTLNANDITAAGGLANPSVALTGSPTAPTAIPGTNTTQVATTAFVTQAIQNIGGVTVSPTPPASPYTGQAWFNSTAGVQQLNIWTGTAWTPSTNLAGYAALAGASFTGPVSLAGNAASALQAVPLQQLNTALAGYLPTAGGTMTGGIVMPGNFIFNTLAGQLNFNFVAGLAAQTGVSAVLNNTNANGVQIISYPSAAAGAAPAAGSLYSFGPNGVVTFSGEPGGVTNLNLNGPSNSVINFATGPAQIYSDAAWFGIGLNSAFNDPSGWRITWNHGTGLLQYNSNVAVLLGMDNIGNMTIHGTLTQGSDAANKTNVSPIAQGISLIRELIPKAFAWLDTPTKTQWGFIAQDVEGVIPVAVSETANNTLALDINAILAAAVYALKQIDQRLTALEAAASITPPASALA